MNILQVTNWLDPEVGGPRNAILLLNKYLNKKGINSVIFTSDKGLKNYNLIYKKVINYEETKVIFYPYPNNFFSKVVNKLYYSALFSSQYYKGLKNLIKEFDIIQVHQFFTLVDLNTFYFCSKYKKPLILKPSGSISKETMSFKSKIFKELYLKFFGKKILDYVVVINALSDIEKVRIEKVIPTHSNKICTIPIGLELEKFKNENLKIYEIFPFLKNKDYILYLGRIHRIKGINILVQAFFEIIKELENIYLVLCGPDNNKYAKEIKKNIKKLGIENKIIFTGPIYDEELKISLLKNAKIFVAPSYYESFGRSIIEALAAKVPVITTNKVGVYKEIKENKAGLIINPNFNELVSAIKMLYNNSALTTCLIENGNKLVQEKYDIEKNVNKFIELYEYVYKQKINNSL
mgnify:CR=1 FL=1